jgi:hypothetical protein
LTNFDGIELHPIFLQTTTLLAISLIKDSILLMNAMFVDQNQPISVCTG